MLKQHVETIAAAFPRSSFHRKNLNRVADYIHKTWEEMGLSVMEQVFHMPDMGEVEEEFPYRNVIVQFSGDGSSKKLVIGAHYDAISNTPGADDNASGIAGLIEIGRFLKENSISTPVELVAYVNEEPPFFGTEGMGSVRHAQKLQKEAQKLLGMISLEMLGYYSNQIGSQKFPLNIMRYFYPKKGNFIAFVSTTKNFSLVRKARRAFSKSSTFPVESFVGPAFIDGLISSDHYAYMIHGFPSMMITDTAYFRNENYHTPDDKPETLDYNSMAMVIEGICGMIKNWPK